jgi:hypothetical protein
MVRCQPVRLEFSSDEEASGPASGIDLAQTFALSLPLSPRSSPREISTFEFCRLPGEVFTFGFDLRECRPVSVPPTG